MGPDWYGRHEWPVYVHGGPLVNYLLGEYGPDRFLRFYTSCRPWSVDQDCRNALGIGLDELDQRFWADLERRASAEPARVGRLRRLKLGRGVTPEAWKTFLDAYLAAAALLIAPYAESRVVADLVHASVGPDGKPSRFPRRMEFVRSGKLRGFRETSTAMSRATVADPSHSFDGRRQGPDAPWIVRRVLDPSADRAYRQALASFNGDDSITTFAPFLLLLAEEWANLVDFSTIQVVGLDRFEEAGERFVRVRLEDTRPGDHPSWRTLGLVVAVADHQAARVVEEGYPDGSNSVGRFLYDDGDGVPLLREFRSDRRMPDGEQRSYYLKIVDRQFGPTPAADLTEARWLDGPREVKGGEPERPARSLANLPGVCLGLGVASIVGGGLLLIPRRSTGL